MLKEKEKIVNIKVNDQDIEFIVKKPSGRVISEAQRISVKTWTDCVKEGIMTKKELQKFMKDSGTWDSKMEKEQEKLNLEISNLEKKLFLGDNNNKLTTSEAKKIAIEMRIKRNQLRELISERLSLEQNTAESLADNARFDFLVSACTFKSDGTKMYNSFEEYNNNSDSEIAIAAATALAEILYSLDKDFEAKLPENKFLLDHHLVNEDLSLINSDGKTVDINGKLINNLGYYINSEGQRTDKDGNLLDENGNYIPTVEYINDIDSKENIAQLKEKKRKVKINS